MTATNDRVIRKVTQTIVPIGTAVDGGSRVLAQWDSHRAQNPHWLVWGDSGSGKTHRVREIIPHLARTMRRVHVIDPDGDIVPNCACDTIKFSETTEFGLNPLEVSDDPDYGGPRKKANAFINLILRQSTLGDRQRNALFRLIIEMYRRYGFNMNDARTWSLDYEPRDWAKVAKRHPNLSDLRKSIWDRFQEMKIGQSGSAHEAFNHAIKMKAKLDKLSLKKLQGEDDEAQYQKAREAWHEALDKGLERSHSEQELRAALEWSSAETIKGIHDRIESLEHSGIFRGRPPAFDETVTVWRYNIASLSVDEAQFFVECLVDKIFNDAKARGEADACDECILIDEAAQFTSPDEDDPINRVATRGRKYGLMLFLSTQDGTTLPPQIIKNTATKLILGVTDDAQAAAERKYGLKPGRLKFIRAQKTALYQTRIRGAQANMSSKFWDIEFPEENS